MLKNRIKIYDRQLIEDERGWFLKTLTGKEEDLPDHTGEIYLTMGLPGQSKGGHYHPRAVEWFTVIQGETCLRLKDVVTDETMEIGMSLKKAQTVFVPNGIAHVFVNTGDEPFVVLAYTNLLYDPKDTIAYPF